MAKLTTCKHCKAQIAKSAKTCPQCGGKNKKSPIKTLLTLVVAIVIIAVVASQLGNNKTPASNNNIPTAKQQEAITYTPYTVETLLNDLKNNALQASEKYKNQYVELTGTLSTIDSDGKYISILPSDNQFAIIGVQCYIKNDAQKSAIMGMTKGDMVKVKGKITQVGEVLGYSLDIDEISK